MRHTLYGSLLFCILPLGACCVPGLSGSAWAGPPKTGSPSPFVQWLAPLNPTTWEMPQLNWPGRQESRPAAEQKSDGIWDGMSRKWGRGWEATKRTLNPTQWWPDSQPSRRQGDYDRSSDDEPGFWSSLWPKRKEPKKIETAVDFLSQPVPY